jgi:hypothetical protein
MRYSLLTLLIVVSLAPPLIAAAWGWRLPWQVMFVLGLVALPAFYFTIAWVISEVFHAKID